MARKVLSMKMSTINTISDIIHAGSCHLFMEQSVKGQTDGDKQDASFLEKAKVLKFNKGKGK